MQKMSMNFKNDIINLFGSSVIMLSFAQSHQSLLHIIDHYEVNYVTN